MATSADVVARPLTWRLVTQLPSGHRLFEPVDASPDGQRRLAIADWSGSVPHTTDDGVLWINDQQPIEVSTGGRGDLARLPLLTATGDPTATVIDFASVVVLSMHHQMRVKLVGGTHDGTLVKVVEA